MRTTIKKLGGIAAKVARAPGDPRLRRVVLCYHSVHPTASLDSVRPERFDDQLNWLAQHCDVVPLREIRCGGTTTSTRPKVALTFDDGYLDNYEYALPAILEHGFTATFFLIAGFIDGDASVTDRLAWSWGVQPDELLSLTWEQVKEMRAKGMEFGSHTWSHANLAGLDDDRAIFELLHSKEIIGNRLGEEIVSIAYPFGKPKLHVTGRTIALAARAGYEWGFVVLPRGVRPSDGPLRIPRFAVGRASLERLSADVAGAMDGHGIIHELAPRWLSQFVFPEKVGSAGQLGGDQG